MAFADRTATDYCVVGLRNGSNKIISLSGMETRDDARAALQKLIGLMRAFHFLIVPDAEQDDCYHVWASETQTEWLLFVEYEALGGTE